MESFLFYLTAAKLFYYKSKGICSRSASRLEANDSLLRIFCFMVHLSGKVRNRSCHRYWAPLCCGVAATLTHNKVHPCENRKTLGSQIRCGREISTAFVQRYFCVPLTLGIWTLVVLILCTVARSLLISSCLNRLRGYISGIYFSSLVQELWSKITLTELRNESNTKNVQIQVGDFRMSSHSQG